MKKKDIFQELLDVRNEIAALQEEEKELKAKIAEEVQEADEKKLAIHGYQFILCKGKTSWTYSNKLTREMEKTKLLLNAKMKNEQDEGIAEKSEGEPYLMIKKAEE